VCTLFNAVVGLTKLMCANVRTRCNVSGAIEHVVSSQAGSETAD